MDKIIAVTGGIGSGKTTFCNCLKRLGLNVISADEIYAELLENPEFVKRVSDAVGVQPIVSDGKLLLDRNAVAIKVFDDSEIKSRLEAITHAAVMNAGFDKARKTDGNVFFEVPLLYEGGFDKSFDKVVVVKRNDDDRISAVIGRDGKSENLIRKIIKSQFDYSKLKKDGHTIFVENNGNVEELFEKAKAVANETNI